MDRGACFCGVDAVATCVRCGERRCAEHYVLAVWYANEPPSGWAQQTPNGNSWIHSPRVVMPDDVLMNGYAAGGPGCIPCRNDAANEAKTSASDVLVDFLRKGEREDLAQLAEASNTLTPEHYIAIGRKLVDTCPRNATLAHVRAGCPKRLKRNQDVHPADVLVLSSEKVPFFPIGNGNEVDIMVRGGTAVASHTYGLLVAPAWRPQQSNEMYILLTGSQPALVSYKPAFRDGLDSWTVTSGVEVSPVHTREYFVGGKDALRSIANGLKR